MQVTRLLERGTFLQTEKQLPLYVSGATTIGELMAHPVTAPIIGGLMQNMQGAMGVMQSDPTENVEDTLVRVQR